MALAIMLPDDPPPSGVTSVPNPVEQLCDQTLAQRLEQLAVRDRGTTAELLPHIAEFERRRLYARAGYPSMHAYCVQRLRMSGDVAFKRIRVARAARRFPGILVAILEGRLNVSGAMLLVPCLKTMPRPDGHELLSLAENLSNREIEKLLAERFPQPDVPTFVLPMVPAASEFRQLAARPVATNTMPFPPAPAEAETHATMTSGPPIGEEMPIAAASFPDHPRVAPLAPGRFAFQMTIGQSAHEKLTRLQGLLSHEIPSGDLERVVERALEIAIAQLEKRKYGATLRPRNGRPLPHNTRHIPAAVRRGVRKRDGERCTYTSPEGNRCEASTMLEFDHIVPFAEGGEATVGNIRLRCRTHNQFEAQQTLGVQFLENKREQARERRKTG